MLGGTRAAAAAGANKRLGGRVARLCRGDGKRTLLLHKIPFPLCRDIFSLGRGEAENHSVHLDSGCDGTAEIPLSPTPFLPLFHSTFFLNDL